MAANRRQDGQGDSVDVSALTGKHLALEGDPQRWINHRLLPTLGVTDGVVR
ncbi:hypothetical protein [Sodalis sp.]|uniref:hypothetical protein n=1 Tax=Sodalis sp. (in: enterobacteria) TaxID=1898979 RepID=UPI00387360BE